MIALYIKDMTNGKVRKYGTNNHDSLEISDDGKTLSYYNLQNGDGSSYGEYRMCDNPKGILPCDESELKKHGADCYVYIGGFKTDADLLLEQVKEILNRSDDYINRSAEYRLSEIKEVLNGSN